MHRYSVDPSSSPCYSLTIPVASESKSTLIYELVSWLNKMKGVLNEDS